MKRIAVVYWSGTGNTEIMAEKIAEGASSTGANVVIYTASDFGVDLMDEYDIIAFGCPSMGAEELEDSEFEPMFEQCRPKLKDKDIVLFGSYSWGSGEWMEEWEENCINDGANLIHQSLIINEEPDIEEEKVCFNLGKKLAE